MTKEQLKRILDSNILLLSSRATNNENLSEFYSDETERGANVLFAPDFNVCESFEDTLKQVVEAAGEVAFTTCCISPVEGGLTLYGGKNTYNEYYNKILNAAKICYDAGVSFLILGGFTNLTEAKCAVLAAKEACPLPICIGLAFDDEIKLENEIDPAKAIITLQALEVNAVGVVGGTNADDTLEVLSQMKEFASVPLFALPTVSEFMTPEDFADYIPEFVGNKCTITGTANGSPVYTAAISKALWQIEPFKPDFHSVSAITGISGILFYDFKNQAISENKQMLEISIENEKEAESLISKLIETKAPPVCFKSKDLDALELAVKLYPGRPAVRSDEYGEIAAKEYGALVLPEGE
ncbi:MAG: homocysteine S-methyltransferase family protein [Clostridia bacterium]|nr:homocysteine S-methyltransferase family protein [Clostridia bacterium]